MSMSHTKQPFEVLEKRQLLSASVALFDAAVVADRAAVHADLVKFNADLTASSAKLTADVTLIRADDAGQRTILAPAFQQLHTDVKTMTTALRLDRLNESAATLADESAIAKTLVQKIKDRGNATAEAADVAELHTERMQLQTDMIAGLDARIATRQADETTIFNDVNTILTTVQGDSNASAKLVAAVSQFATDRTARLNTINGDLQTLVTARTQLLNDLASEA